MYKNYITIVLLYFFFSLYSNAQNVSFDSAETAYEFGELDIAEKQLVFLIQNIDDKNILNKSSALIGKVYGQKGLYTKANEYLNKNSLDNSLLSYAEILNTKGYLAQQQGYPTAALNYLNDAFKITEASEKSLYKSKISIETLSLIAISNWQLGAQEDAIDYGKEALNISNKINDDIDIANCNINLGLLYSKTDTYKAQYYYEKALEEYIKVYPTENHPAIASIYINLGITFEKNYFTDKAISSFEKAASIWEKTYGGDHPNVAFAYTYIAEAYLKKNQGDLANEFYDFALTQYQNVFGEKHPEIANIYIKLGEIAFKTGETQKAIDFYQKALIANNKDFNDSNIYATPEVNNYLNPFTNIVALQKKAFALKKRHYQKTLKRQDLICGYNSLYLAHNIIENVRAGQKNKEDKIQLSAITNDVYSDGIQICIALSEASISSQIWIENAFQFVEWSKSASLLEAIQETNAKSFAGIPDKLIVKEEHIQEEIHSIEQALIKSDKIEERDILESKLFEKEKELENHIKLLENEYPNYFDLKYNHTSFSYKDVKEKLTENEAIISYFISEKDEKLYIFVATSSNLKIYKEEFTQELQDEIISLETGLKFNFDEIVFMSSKYLSDILFPFILPNKINHLIFLLDGRINNIPMDVLFTEVVGDEMLKPVDYPFLTKKYAISYNYSSTLALNTKSIDKNETMNIACFAPIFFRDSTGTDNFNQLDGTLSEVREIDKVFKEKNWLSSAYLYDKAKKSILKSEKIKDYTHLHFATHGLVDEEHPNQSFIYLVNENKSEGLLYASEIYNLEFNADLVTLSACETGLGKLTKGEGLIGLSRSLKYAGVDNTIVSLWTVDDISTALLMQYFYKELTIEYNLPMALQKAKIRLIKEGLYTSPYYWSSFSLIGR
ncbi:CHAT domain-containing protein [Flammeovirga kamogawensis]|uniref:CHAT domain-containing protein n=1 Tax=Flammeovirga kamogawensis TaxID=373891 RepID=A0ABX8GVQ5_9BACT|nr:CHAT domain-containing protein [Flammeovirga kamogawensis]MBB6461112.1 CHAT domain-containing protein/predicted negative regulator of RcsB-dependent stress response [Flammeovirga kamogawensis]QWG07678.1 CHAT domain-containing protein [Flammeovirga kamogawensis]TRX69488.1 CHAT domain-containing protein [Flammeovirga kamogawensis]